MAVGWQTLWVGPFLVDGVLGYAGDVSSQLQFCAQLLSHPTHPSSPAPSPSPNLHSLKIRGHCSAERKHLDECRDVPVDYESARKTVCGQREWARPTLFVVGRTKNGATEGAERNVNCQDLESCGMNEELQTVVNYMERERGIDREVLFKAVEFALQSAARKTIERKRDLRVEINRKTCDIKAFAKVTVADPPRNPAEEISLQEARKLKPGVKVGDEIEIEVTPRNFGRIAAQTAKQAIIQKIRQAEKERVFEEYKDRVGTIVSGTVRQFNRSDIVVDLGKAEGVIPAKERVPTEEYQIGDRIRALVLSVQGSGSGPAVVLSRTHPDFVAALFKLEVSEIAEGVVEIKSIAREPGYRTKVAVASNDPKVDPVGACVGMRGIRVKNIVRELSGEKIDIVRWSDDLRTYVQNGLSPAKLTKVTVDPDHPDLVHVVADPDQLSLAIGKRGQNVRLTAKLIGVKIDVQKDDAGMSFEEKKAKAVADLAAIPGIGNAAAEALVNAGFLTVEGILAADINDLVESGGLDAETARAVYEAAAAAQSGEPEQSERKE